MNAAASKKVTLATLKAFIRNNRSALLIRVNSDFDGMSDCVRQTGERTFTPALAVDEGRVFSNNLGIQGVWFVGGSRDYFSPIVETGLFGYRVSNCCGSFELAIPPQAEQLAA